MIVILIGGLGNQRRRTTPSAAGSAPGAKGDRSGTTRSEGRSLNNATQPASSHRLSLLVKSAKTGEPLERVSVSCEIRGDGKPHEETLTTGKDGTAPIEWPQEITAHWVGLKVKKPGYVGLFLYWDERHHPISLPESFEARLEPGVPISGVVQDDGGKPIAQANVTAMATATEGEAPHYSYDLGTTKTDEQGRWRIDEAPANVSDMSLHVDHPDYRREPGAMGGGREWRTILSKASSVKGRVVDGSGKPVKGALVDTGGDRHRDYRTPATTDELGDVYPPRL